MAPPSGHFTSPLSLRHSLGPWKKQTWLFPTWIRRKRNNSKVGRGKELCLRFREECVRAGVWEEGISPETGENEKTHNIKCPSSLLRPASWLAI